MRYIDAVYHCAVGTLDRFISAQERRHANYLVYSNFLGDFSREVTPVPIPNTVVKLSSADGTARATVWESRSLPGLFEPAAKGSGLSCFMAPNHLPLDG